MMRLNRIEKVNILNSSGKVKSLEKAEKAFLNKEFMTENDIKELAAEIGDAIVNRRGTNDNIMTIIDALRPEAILEKTPELKKEISQSEIDPALERIREAIIDHLSTKLDPKTFNFIKRQISIKTKRIYELHGDKIYKRGFYQGRDQKIDPDVVIAEKERLETIHSLYALDEQSPYIAYTMEGITGHAGEVEEIQKKKDFTTLYDFLHTGKPKINEAFQLLENIMQANLFLIEHGFALTDNRLTNMAVFIDSKTPATGAESAKMTAKIFDLDGLLKLNGLYDKDILYLSESYTSPELLSKGQKQVGEPQIVYELGTCLKKIFYIYENKASQELKTKIWSLAGKMISNNPSDRIPLKNGIAELRKIIEAA